MGMYTEIVVNLKLKEECSDEVLTLLKIMGGEKIPEPATLPSHSLFIDTSWKFLFCCSSFYHIPFAIFKLEKQSFSFYLSARADIKNYNGEIAKFFDWIRPYIDENFRDFIGYELYEEWDKPKLYFRKSQT